MGLGMLDSGNMIKLMARGSYNMLMEMFMKENGKMIKLMVMVLTTTQTEPCTRAIGVKTNSTDTEWKPGLMGLIMKETSSMEIKKEKGLCISLMVQSMKEAFLKTQFTAMVSISGQTKRHTKASGT